MLDDGLPKAFVMTAQERRALWEANPPHSIPFQDPRLEADRKLRAQQKELATAQRIDALRQSKGLKPVYNATITTNQPQEEYTMKLVIKPLDQHGAPVLRGMTSVKDDATPEQIDAQVQHAVKRGGRKVAVVLLVGADRQPIKAWEVTENVIAPINVTPYLLNADQLAASSPATEAQPSEQVADQSEESEVVKKAKKATKAKSKKTKTPKAPKTKKVPGAGGLRAGSKQETLYNMLTRKSGCTIDEAIKATGWQSCSVATWGKKFGLKVTKEKSATGIVRYYGA